MNGPGGLRVGLVQRLRFRQACRRNDDTILGALSDPVAALKSELLERRVAIVGNARALADTAHGASIDGCDLVIRINRAPMPDPRSHGTRTDWLALATTLKEERAATLRPQRILWMSHKRKRLALWVALRSGFFLYPMAEFEALRDKLGAPPTTGLMMIDFVSRSGAESIELFGFDFFASLSLTGRRKASQVPHDFSAERRWVEQLAARDRRIRVN